MELMGNDWWPMKLPIILITFPVSHIFPAFFELILVKFLFNLITCVNTYAIMNMVEHFFK